MNEFGRGIRNARENLGLTCEELGELCGITSKHLMRIETGKVKKPFPWTIKVLTDYLDISVYELMENEEKTLTNIVRNARLCKGYTQQDLAKASGISVTTITKIETGKMTRPQMDTLKKLMETLDIASDIFAQVYEFNIPDTLGNIVKIARLRKGICQGELACRCEISQVHLSGIERGIVTKPKTKTLKKLSECLNLNFDKLMEICGYLKKGEETFAKKVRSARLRNGLSQRELAHMCEISVAYVSYIEKGKEIGPELKEKLENILGLNKEGSVQT